MADSSFGLKIGLEGEREFKRAIMDINREMRVLGSKMKLVASSFDKNDKSAPSPSARTDKPSWPWRTARSTPSHLGRRTDAHHHHNPSQAPYLWATSTHPGTQ